MTDLFVIGGIPWWAVLLIALAALAVLTLQFLSLKERLSRPRSWALTLLRGLVYAFLIFFLLSPGLLERRITKLRRPLALLVDTSQSMGFPSSPDSGQSGGKTRSRLDLVKSTIADNFSKNNNLLQRRKRTVTRSDALRKRDRNRL